MHYTAVCHTYNIDATPRGFLSAALDPRNACVPHAAKRSGCCVTEIHLFHSVRHLRKCTWRCDEMK